MKFALVIGCAEGNWKEAEAALRLGSYDSIYCVKQAGIYYPHFNVWVTLHPEIMDAYEIERKALGLPDDYQIVAPPPSELGSHANKGNIARRVSYLWSKESNASASSGIYGAKVALEDGFDRVVLAGIPMSSDAGHFKPESKTVSGQVRGKVWNGCAAFEVGFKVAIPHLIGKVKSMSGRTKEILGAPTKEWLA